MENDFTKEEKSRAELIIHELECGGFTEDELDDIIKAYEKAKENKAGKGE